MHAPVRSAPLVTMEGLETRALLSASPTPPTSGSGGAPPPPPPPPPILSSKTVGATLNKDGTLCLLGDPAVNTTACVTLSKDGKTLTATVAGKSSTFDAAKVKHVGVFTGAGNDCVTVNLGSLKIAADVMTGPGNDTISTGAEVDHIWAGDGNDTVSAGAGNDLLDGGKGADQLHAGDGDDTLIGSATEGDTLDGGAGNNKIVDPKTLPPPPQPPTHSNGGAGIGTGSGTGTSITRSLFSSKPILT